MLTLKNNTNKLDSMLLANNRIKNIQVSYIDFSGKINHNGEILVLDVAVESVKQIFGQLLAIKFPINSIINIEKFDYDDEKSMSANNSSAFNHRYIAGTKILSIHSYGLAIDINPTQNPYLTIFSANQGLIECHPKNGLDYLNRTNLRPGMVEPIVDIFKNNGFSVWGGKWNKPLDYHHFQTSRFVAEMLAMLEYEQGIELFNFYKNNYHYLNKITDDNIRINLINLLNKDKNKFLKNFYQHAHILQDSQEIDFLNLMGHKLC